MTKWMMDQVTGRIGHHLDPIQLAKPSSIINPSSIYFIFSSTFLNWAELISIGCRWNCHLYPKCIGIIPLYARSFSLALPLYSLLYLDRLFIICLFSHLQKAKFMVLSEKIKVKLPPISMANRALSSPPILPLL